ncbi:MAG TPA: lactonase family protein [Chryseolinea sp.]|nr:lactonase family protein [Chryseolinea sp.]
MMKKVILLFCSILSFLGTAAQTKKEILYVGTFSVRGSEGIYAYTFNRAKRTLTPLQTVPSLESPSFLAIHPSGKFLYSVNRGKADTTDHGGSVSAYGIDRATGRLSGINHRSSYGDGPCYVSVDQTGKFIFVAHYGEGTLTVLTLFKDGSLGSPSDAKKYSGKGLHKERQEGPHIHAALLSPDNKFLYVVDLGTDKIYIYEFNSAEGTLQAASTPEARVTPGAGPRHLTFHPSGDFAYLAEELTSTVAVFSVDKLSGALTILQDTVKSLPPNFTDKNSSADIHTDVSGKYLYMSNRGSNTLSIYVIGKDGKITLVGHQNTGGKTPRNFLVDPKGEYIFVANQDTDTINLFRINQKTGRLTAVGKPVHVPSPVCLKLVTLN